MDTCTTDIRRGGGAPMKSEKYFEIFELILLCEDPSNSLTFCARSTGST